jgi:hypothetical protein
MEGREVPQVAYRKASMSKIAGTETTLDLMVNCKTYPAVSTKYVETVCTGGVQITGEFVRLYPVQFRFLDADQKYKRWDVIRVRAYRDSKDTRPESWHLSPGTDIEVLGSIKTPEEQWTWMQPTVHASREVMDTNGITNGCVEIEPIELYWEHDEVEWTASQLKVIEQRDFFLDSNLVRAVAQRVPFQFRLRYVEKSTRQEGDGKVLQWSYYEGYQKRKRKGLSDSEAMEQTAEVIRQSIFKPTKKVFAIFGTHSRFKNWMISALYHLPADIVDQGKLF